MPVSIFPDTTKHTRRMLTTNYENDEVPTVACYVIADEDIDHGNQGAECFEDDESVTSLSDTTNCEIFGLDDVYIDRRSHSFTAFSYDQSLHTEFSNLIESKENDLILKTDFKEAFLKTLLDIDMDFALDFNDERGINIQLLLCRELVMESYRNEENLRSDLLFFQNENRRIEIELTRQLTNQALESQRIETILRKELSDLQVETERVSGALKTLQKENGQVEDSLRKELIELREENERLIMQSQQFNQYQSELIHKLTKSEEETQQHISRLQSSTTTILEERNKYESKEKALSVLSQELEDMSRKYHELSTLRTAEQITLNFIVNQNKVVSSDGNGNGFESEREASYPARLIDPLLTQIQQGLEELCLPFSTPLGAPPLFLSEAFSHRNGSVQVNRNFYPKLKSLLVAVQHQIKSLLIEKKQNRNIYQYKGERNSTCLQHGLIEAGRAIRQLNLLLFSNGKGDRNQSRMHELRRSLLESLEAIEAINY